MGRAAHFAGTHGPGVVTAVGLVYSIASGFGVNLPGAFVLDPTQRIYLGGALVVVGLVWEIGKLRAQLYGHADAPIIGWVDPSLTMRDDGSLLLEVWCENSGPRDSEVITVADYCESSHKDEGFNGGVNVWSRILSRKNGDQHRFQVMYYTDPPEKPWFGQREIKWGMVYFDATDRDRRYVTECSIQVDVQEVGSVHIEERKRWLDATSTKEERVKRWQQREKNAKRRNQ